MLTALGVIFFVFSAQERKTAEFYSEAAKATQYDLSADSLMDFGLEQLIVGPNQRYRNSALFGRRHSLIPNMLGMDSTGQYLDLAPYNGVPFLPADQFYNQINDSPVANGGFDPNYQMLANRDPDYTYPDPNNLFISYVSYDPVGNLVVIPSFHRPQNLRGSATWYSDANTVNRLLRPHPNHVYVPPPGQQQSSSSTNRFLHDAEAVTLWGAGAKGFPFQPYDQNGDGKNEQGVWGAPIPRPVLFKSYEYDVDNDGDGIFEGVWMDLDFPVQESIDGKLYVPLYSMTVIDVDALLNLNVHGNMARVWNGDLGLASPFWNTLADPSVSVSNQGILPSEVTPMWGFNRRPAGVGSFNDGTYAADQFYVNNPVNWYETANRELSFLMLGRYSTSPTDLVPGRWGEESFLYKAITTNTSRTTNAFSYDTTGGALTNPWPGPGQTKLDDNGDLQQEAGAYYGGAYESFGHPMDFTGLGNYYAGKTANYASAGIARWPTYNRYSNSTPSAKWTAMTNSIQNALFNDGAETVVDADNLRTEDAQFGPDEMRALFLNSTDFSTAVGASSRLTSLAPFNIDTTVANFPNSAKNTQLYRNKFTTRSWDRKQFVISKSPTRPWEFTADANNNQRYEFPPIFGGPAGSTEFTSLDLFRPVTRLLLQTELNNNNTIMRSMRLSVNQLLVGPNGNPYPSVTPASTGTLSRVPNISLNYRPITAHPDPTTLTAAPITNAVQSSHGGVGNLQNSYPANGNFGGDNQFQEYWARCDRQLLARDIFSVLYVMGWPDGMNPGPPATDNTATPPTTYPTLVLDNSTQGIQNQITIRQMAQFAVNLVDSLDGDNIPTRFEYDINPSNGWNVNDDPYENSTDTERAEVWGVERLDLTLSEALVVTAPSKATDLPFTQWDDTKLQNFCFVELRNPSPNSVDLSQKAWRVDVGPDYASATDPTLVRRLKLLNGSIAPGKLFTIGSADRTTGGTNPSVMKIMHTGAAGSAWDTDTTTWIAPAQKKLDLDLKDGASSSRYSLADATGAAVANGALFDSDTLKDIYVRLYRRANPTRPAPTTATEEVDNPFVMVDQIHIDNVQTDSRGTAGGKLNLLSSDTQATIETALQNLSSLQTREPFFGSGRTTRAGGTPKYYANTLAADNKSTTDATPAYFTRWQKVFDRSFASLAEIMQPSLGGFSNTEILQKRFSASPTDPLAVAITVPGDSPAAEDQFIKPGTLSSGASRWYRLLEIIDVPTREHVGIPGLATPIDFPRVPGKINLNMIRHPEVLAALFDDPSIMSVLVDEDANFNGTLDSGEDLNSNGVLDSYSLPRVYRKDLTIPSAPSNPYPINVTQWWQGLLFARDGSRSGGAIQPDTISNRYLPGVSTARPFRSFTNATGSYTSVEDTVLRSWPDDTTNTDINGTNDPRQLFELGTQDEHIGHDQPTAMNPDGNPVAQIDPYVRRRLLAKLMNNTTTRSNVFVVFMSVKNFRADASSGAVRIGGPLTGNAWEPDHRGFFVIDRTQLEKAYDSSTNSFNFRSFIEFRQILQ